MDMEKPKLDARSKPEIVLEFRSEKAAVSKYLNRERAGEDVGVGFEENTGKLDDNVKELIYSLNSLPFLYTAVGSCGGHIFSRSPGATHVKYTAGEILFRTDGSKKSVKFLEMLSEIVSRYDGAELTIYPPDNYLPCFLIFGRRVGRRSIDLDLAKKLELEREKLKSEVLQFVKKFSD